MLKKYFYPIFSSMKATNTICFQLVSLLSLTSSFLVLGQSPTMTNDQIDSLIRVTNPSYNNDNSYTAEHYKNILNNSIANDYTKGIINSYFCLGRYYHFKNIQVDSALYFYDRTTLFIEKNGAKEKEVLAIAHGHKAILLSESGMAFLSLASFEKAYKTFLEIGNKAHIATAILNLAELNRVLGNNKTAISLATEMLEDTSDLDEYDKSILNGIIGTSLIQDKKPEQALTFLKISDSIYQEHNLKYESLFIETHTWIAQAYLDMENLDSAIHTCENMLAEFPDYQGNLKLVHLILGKALFKNGQTALAIQTLEKALKSKGTQKDQIAILETLANSYLSRKSIQKAQPLLSESIRLRDSIQDARAKHFSRYSSISYNLLETQFKNDNLAHKNEVLEAKAIEREYLLGVLILSITVILLSILGYVLWKKYHTGKKTIQSLKANEKAILEAQIKLREDELSATMVHFTKNMKTIKTIVKDLDSSLAKKDYGALQMVKTSLQEYQKSSSTASLLTDRIESQYPGISMQLRELYPNFSPNDIKHSLMIKLGLSLKETAQLFNITIAAVKSARGRMRKKMDLDPDISLKQHLSFIAKSA